MKNNLDTGRLLSRQTFAYFALFVSVLFLFIGILFWRALLTPVETGKGSGDVGVTIPGNSSCAKIGEILYENGLVRGPGLVSFYARLHGVDQNLKPGRYIFNRGQSLPEIVDLLAKGAPDVIIFTMPEGYTLAQLTDLLSSKGLADRERFKEYLAGASFKLPFLEKIPSGVGLEGYLFPDTYHVGSSTGEEQIISIMLNRFKAELDKLDYEKKAARMNLSLHQALTIASMIEGEAVVDEERPIIAGVIYNRLSLGMPLQIDATVKYALGGNVKRILYKDLEIDSPYNTYRVTGLPPGPINSPGEASLVASVNPARTNYLYYVAKPDGTHAFAATLEEHNNNRRMYQ